MLPQLTLENFIHSCVRQAICSGDLCACDPTFVKEPPGFPDRLFCHLCKMVVRSSATNSRIWSLVSRWFIAPRSHARISTFENHVKCVLPLRTFPQMPWIDTSGIVTTMTNSLVFRKLPEDKKPHDPMGEEVSVLPSFDVSRKQAVSVLVSSSIPLPTVKEGNGGRDAGPKTFDLLWGKLQSHFDLLCRVPHPRQLALRGGFRCLNYTTVLGLAQEAM